jgi:hypothetical protein
VSMCLLRRKRNLMVVGVNAWLGLQNLFLFWFSSDYCIALTYHFVFHFLPFFTPIPSHTKASDIVQSLSNSIFKYHNPFNSTSSELRTFSWV